MMIAVRLSEEINVNFVLIWFVIKFKYRLTL
jgi:hypothetical protein